MSDRNVGDNVHIGHGVGAVRIDGASENTSPDESVAASGNRAKVLAALESARRRMGMCLRLQDRLIAFYRKPVAK